MRSGAHGDGALCVWRGYRRGRGEAGPVHLPVSQPWPDAAVDELTAAPHGAGTEGNFSTGNSVPGATKENILPVRDCSFILNTV